MTISTTRMTADQFIELGEDPVGVHLELVEGAVAVSPSPVPKHSFAIMRLSMLLGQHLMDDSRGELYSDVDTILNRFNVRRPDILYFSASRTYLVGDKAIEGPPDLAVEVISPSSRKIDRTDKFNQYRKAGVAFYWIVDPEKRTVEAWALKQKKYVAVGKGKGSQIVRLPPFADLDIPLARLWRA